MNLEMFMEAGKITHRAVRVARGVSLDRNKSPNSSAQAEGRAIKHAVPNATAWMKSENCRRDLLFLPSFLLACSDRSPNGRAVIGVRK